MSCESLRDFSKSGHEKLFACLAGNKRLTPEETESLVYALKDISESIIKVYEEIIPRLINEESNEDMIKSVLWSLREEFRHIEYHIRDGNLQDL